MKYFAVHSNPSFGRWLWFFTFCIAGLLVLFWKGGPAESRVNSAADTSLVSSSSAHKPTESLTRGKFREIQDLRVGDRVLAENPEVGAAERAAYVEPDWRRWLQISLQMPKADGSVLEMELLRPDEWLIEQATLLVDEPSIEYVRADLLTKSDAEVEEVRGGCGPVRPAFADLGWRLELTESCGLVASGFVVQMDLPELGLTGESVVVEVQPAPVVKAGTGRVVTATFKHSSGGVIDLVVAGDGSQETLGTTSNHPFWSVDRQDYVQAGKLELGERLQTYSGDTKRVVSKLARPGPEPVFNLEVHAEHVYYVGQQGLLVHNSQDYDDIATNLGGNRGVIRELEGGDQRMRLRESAAEVFEDGLVGAASDVASGRRIVPALQFTPPRSTQNPFVRLDGVEPGTSNVLIDRKLSLVRFPTRSGPMIPQATRIREVSEALRQNPGHRLIFEFPTADAARDGRRILREIGVSNIEVRNAN